MIKNSLKENGTAAIQGITIRDDLFDRYRGSEDFIQKYIFPGGFLPSVNFMKYLVKKNKLNLLKINRVLILYGIHYCEDFEQFGEKIFLKRGLKYHSLRV